MYTLTEAARLLRDRRLSSLELTQACLANIERLNPVINAFITVTDQLALRQAKQADAELAAENYRGPLHGIPIALKDLIDVEGIPTTAASKQFTQRISQDDAAIVVGLKQAGAVILGKTNLHEFAFGGSGVVSAHGPARNPWDTSRITGGSSSGSAAAVASGMCIAAIGTDTAGSVRIPAALCGILGHRPSTGVWSSEGIIPLRKSFDTPGPMTRTVEDASLLMRSIGERPAPVSVEINRLRLGVAREGFYEGLDAEVATSLQHAEDVLRALVGSMRDVTVKVDARWSSFDGEILDYHQPMLEATPELYQSGTLARLRTCSVETPEQYRAVKSAVQEERLAAEKVFDDVDVVVTPTCVEPAPRIGDLQAMSAAELRAYEVEYLLRNTAPFSLLYWPTVSVPCGFTNSGLPIGMQISARPGADEVALQVAAAYEQATAWHKRLPPIVA